MGRRGYHEHDGIAPHPVRTGHLPSIDFDDEPRTRGRPPKMHKCFGCALLHPGWRREQVRTKGKVEYCEEHYPQPNSPFPTCPECGNNFEYFVWNGSVKKTTVHCFCSAAGEKGWRALDFFDALTIKIQAAPIVGV